MDNSQKDTAITSIKFHLLMHYSLLHQARFLSILSSIILFVGHLFSLLTPATYSIIAAILVFSILFSFYKFYFPIRKLLKELKEVDS